MCPTPIEGLAANGIVHFDPEAYLRDGSSQYISEQSFELPFDRPMYATPFVPYPVAYINPGQPHRDVYVRHEEKHSSSWTGALIGAVIGGLATYLGYEVFKGKDNVIGSPEVKPEVKSDVKATLKTTGEKVKKGTEGFFTDCKDYAIGAKDKFVGWVKGKRVETEVDKVISEAAKNPAKEQKGYFATRFYKTKIALGVAAGLAVLYAVYKAFTGRSQQSSKE